MIAPSALVPQKPGGSNTRFNSLLEASIRVEALDRPVEADCPEAYGGKNLQAVDEPDRHRAGLAVAPEDVALAVGRRDHPVERHNAEIVDAHNRKAVEQPGRQRAGVV